MSYSKSLEKIGTYMSKSREALEILAPGPSDFEFERIRGYVNGLFERFCPFKVGDKVRLAVTPEISETVAHGWLGSKHFLVKGAVATIAEIDYEHPQFTFLLSFENESWVPSTTWGDHVAGVVYPIPPDRRHVFHFRECDVEVCPA